MNSFLKTCLMVLLTAIFLLFSLPALSAEEGFDAGELAKKTQNPVAAMISVPFQNNTNFGFGPGDDVQNVLNIQPVWPFKLSGGLNLITRTIFPIVAQPELASGAGRTFGLGDTSFTGFISPSKPGKIIWGAGPVLLLPTATDENLGTGKWGFGPSFVVLTKEKQWVYGALWNNIWSFAGKSSRSDVNQMLLQLFVNYNFTGGWYVTSAPIITANWKASEGDKWVVPLGGGGGRVFRAGKLPLNAGAQVYYNIVQPDMGPVWQLRAQVTLLFPK